MSLEHVPDFSSGAHAPTKSLRFDEPQEDYTQGSSPPLQSGTPMDLDPSSVGTNKSILKKIFTMEPNHSPRHSKNPKYNKTTSNFTPNQRSSGIKAQTQAKSKFIKGFTHLSTINSGKFLISSSDSDSQKSNKSHKGKGKLKKQPTFKKPFLAPHYRPSILGAPLKLKFPTRRLGTNISIRSGKDSDDEKISKQIMHHSKMSSPFFNGRQYDGSKDPSILSKKIVEKKGKEVGLQSSRIS
jgi:hypothetical protein